MLAVMAIVLIVAWLGQGHMGMMGSTHGAAAHEPGAMNAQPAAMRPSPAASAPGEAASRQAG